LQREYYPVPRLAQWVIDKMNEGWRPRCEWDRDIGWLKFKLIEHRQTEQSFATGLGIKLATAKRYIRDGGGPKRYIMIAAEAWFEADPPPAVTPRRGRPPTTWAPPSSKEQEYAHRLQYDYEFAERSRMLTDMIMRWDGTPAERLEDIKQIKALLGY
jgi:hypothetical protein